MATSGRKPKPTALKLITGGQRLNHHEPKIESGAPDCPEWLDLEAKAEWARLLPQMVSAGLLTQVDMAVFAGYCQAFSNWAQAERFVEANGQVLIMRNDKGEVRSVQITPQVHIALKMMDRMKGFAVEMGLSPSSRSRVHVQIQNPKSGWDSLETM